VKQVLEGANNRDRVKNRLPLSTQGLEVFLSENAFLSMTTAAIETFPDETLGTLIGLIKKTKIFVQHAVPYQTAKRDENGVETSPKHSKRMEAFLAEVTHLETVGDFHSHPSLKVIGRGYGLSKRDKNSTMTGGLGIVVVVDRDGKERQWEHLKRGSLVGSIPPFSLRVTSWFKSEEDSFQIAEIHCPYALGLGR